MEKLEVYTNKKLEFGSNSWVKWVAENNPHLTRQDLYTVLSSAMGYTRALNFLISQI